MSGVLDTPFAKNEHCTTAEESIKALVAMGESKLIEFKSTGRCNLHTGNKDPKIEWSLLKTTAAFANTYGGTLLVGVGDDGGLTGLGHDLPFVPKQDVDGWELWLTNAVTQSMGKVVAADLDVTIVNLDGHAVARIEIGPSAKPVFAQKDGKPAFMVRVNNSTVELAGQEALDYQTQRW